MNYEPLLQIISDRYSEILGDNLVGIYVHGSIAFQCFRWDNSDIDFIVVVNRELSQQTKHGLLSVLGEMQNQAPEKGFEMSVVEVKFCKHFEHPNYGCNRTIFSEWIFSRFSKKFVCDGLLSRKIASISTDSFSSTPLRVESNKR